MRRVIILLLILASFIVKAQNVQNANIEIRIACGFAGVTSTGVNNIQQLVSSKTYILLKRKLYSDNKTEVLLSAIALQEMYAKHLVNLTPDEKQKIKEIANWDDKYSVCSGCTDHFEGKVSELLMNKQDPAYLLICRTIFKID